MCRRFDCTSLKGLFAILAGLALMIGCGLGQTPLAPDQEAAITEAVQPLIRAAKPTKKTATGAVKATTKTISGGGRSMTVKFRKYGAKTDVIVKEVRFTVAPNSIVGGGTHDITMTVYSGTTLDDVNVVFEPSGLQFDEPADLRIKLGGPANAGNVQQAQHIHGNGAYVESVSTETDKNGNSYLVVELKVPGFSRYSLGIGD